MNKTIQKILVFFVLATVAVYAAHDISNLDIWYHLRCGEFILENWNIPQTNTFSYIAADQPGHDPYWLFQVLIYLIHRVCGISGLILFKISVLACAFFLLFRIRNKDPGCILPVSCLLLAAMAANSRFIVRPELASYLLLSLYLYILYQYKSRKGRSVYLLIPLQVLWVNMHGFWVLGLFLVWAFVFGELILWKLPLPFEWKKENAVRGRDYYRLLTVGFLMTAATLITPDPYKMLQLPFDMFGSLKGATGRGGPLLVNELISPFSANPLFSWQAIFYYKVLVVASVTAFLLNFRRINISHLLIWAGFLYISIQARRNIAAFALVSAPIMFLNLSSFYKDYIKRFTCKKARLMTIVRSVFSAALVAAMAFLIYDAVSDRYYIRDRSNARFGFGISKISYPEKAIDFIQENNLQGNIFNEPATGHYFTWRCYPDRKVFLDGRFDLPERFLSHYYVPELWPRISEKYNINYVLLGHGRSSDLAGLVRMLFSDKGWALIYYDEMAVVFIRDMPENRQIIEEFQVSFHTINAETAPRKNLFGQRDIPVARFQLGNFFVSLGLRDQALKMYEECVEIFPDFWEAHSNLADMYRGANRMEDALTHYRKAVEIKPNFAAGHVRLGDVYASRREVKQAIAAYKKAIAIQPGMVMAHKKLALLYFRIKDYKKAITTFEAVLNLDPTDQMARQMLAYSRQVSGK